MIASGHAAPSPCSPWSSLVLLSLTICVYLHSETVASAQGRADSSVDSLAADNGGG